MSCWVYVLRGADGKSYTGMTTRLSKRIREHNQGRTPADRGRGPFSLACKEECPGRRDARGRRRVSLGSGYRQDAGRPDPHAPVPGA